MDLNIYGYNIINRGPETPEFWSLQFQTKAIFADNLSYLQKLFPKFADNLDI